MCSVHRTPADGDASGGRSGGGENIEEKVYSLVHAIDLERSTLDCKRDPSVSDQLSFEKLNEFEPDMGWQQHGNMWKREAGIRHHRLEWWKEGDFPFLNETMSA